METDLYTYDETSRKMLPQPQQTHKSDVKMSKSQPG